MSDIALEVRGLGKRYRIGIEKNLKSRYKSLRDSLGFFASRPLHAIRSALSQEPMDDSNSFWALSNINFEITTGEVVGIIGRNGAGKSTLLKLLSRITKPTTGHALVHGRVGSLLEVGTGFHPELTGRENIFLNGAIIGMTRAEVRSKFDEIVAFSEIEKFLDTPVKHYSSGMYTRLAFAVAAHLDPEILIVDEVLAVGDIEFQKKCLGKMKDVAATGRTILFVSHNIQALSRLCHRCILLRDGCVVIDGPAAQVISHYLWGDSSALYRRTWNDGQVPGNHVARLEEVSLTGSEAASGGIDIRFPFNIEIAFSVTEAGHVLYPNINITNSEGVCAFAAIDSDPAWRDRKRPAGAYVSKAIIPGNMLAEGTHSVTVAISSFDPLSIHALAPDAVAFNIVDPILGDSARGRYTLPMPGVVRPLLSWSTATAPAEDSIENTRVRGTEP
jgi:lipopolysaccharide transport system ATP-binding protein